MGKLYLAFGLMKPHLCQSVAHVLHLSYTQYGYRPALMHGHFELSRAAQVGLGRGYRYALVGGVECLHALHHAIGKLRRAHGLASVGPQLARLHDAVARHRCIGHPHLVPYLGRKALVVAALAPAFHLSSAADYCPLAVGRAYDRGTIGRSAVLGTYEQGLVQAINAAAHDDVYAPLGVP